jgi:3'-phosphoadenosine 5'-phosphosulfate (PAPS) 3'-phosphatase
LPVSSRTASALGGWLTRAPADQPALRSIMVQEEQGLDTKKDRSLVTTADYAAQALISWCAAQAAPAAGGSTRSQQRA